MITPLVEALRATLSPNIPIDFLCRNNGAQEYLNACYPEAKIHILPNGKATIRSILLAFFKIRKHRYTTAFLGVGISSLYPLLLKLVSGIPSIHWEGQHTFLFNFGISCHPPHDGHRVIRNLRLGGFIVSNGPQSFPAASPQVHQDTSNRQDRNIVAIHPGSSRQQGATKRPDVRVLLSVEHKLKEVGEAWETMRLFGPDENELMDQYPEDKLHYNILVGSIPQLFSLLARCRLLIAGDSGYGHLAAAVGIPVITLAGPTVVDATRPWTAHGAVLRTQEPLTCMPCYETPNFYSCPYENRCMRSISADDIILTLKQLTHDAN